MFPHLRHLPAHGREDRAHTYPEWEEAFVKGGGKAGLTAVQDGVIINFKTPELLEHHFGKHGFEFGDISIKEYLQGASRMHLEPLSDDVQELLRSDDSVAKYKFSTNEFLAVTKEGFIRTYFKPVKGAEYWSEEHERN